MSNSSQSNAEVTAQIFLIKKKIESIEQNLLNHENDPFVKQWRQRKNEYILQYAESLEQLYDLGDTIVKDVESISAFITNRLVDLGFEQHEADYTRKALPKKYKRQYPDDVNRENARNINAVPLNDLKELDDEQLRAFIKKSKADADHALFEATNRGLAIVDHDERDPTIETEVPPELETDFYFSLFDLAQQLEDFKDNVLGLAVKVKQFPITDEKINKQRAIETRTFAQFFYGLNQRMMRSLIDEKFAFSEFEWHNTIVKEENYSKHGAAVKSKIAAYTIKDGKPVPTGQYRVLTREVVGDNKEEVVQDLHGTCASFDAFAWLNGWVKWRDIEGFMTQLVANRRIKLNPKLSSTAFGADSGKEFHDE